MNVHIPDEVADLLLLWWRSESRAKAVSGYPTECPSTRGYTSRYRGGADDVDSLRESRIVARVAATIDALDPDMRSAAHILARNLATGLQVWSSARIPAGPVGQALFIATVDELALRLGVAVRVAA